MPAIRCNGCGYTKSRDLVGTKAELKYMRVMDTTQSGSTDKLFFCTDTCYLNRHFLIHANRVCKMPIWQMSMFHAMKDPVLGPFIADTTRKEYDDIVAEYEHSAGLKKFREATSGTKNGNKFVQAVTGKNEVTNPQDDDTEEVEDNGINKRASIEKPQIVQFSSRVTNWADEV